MYTSLDHQKGPPCPQKVPKAASSTTASVWHRISRNNGNCDFREEHHYGKHIGNHYGNRDKSASFLLGSIRDPASRAIHLA